MGRKFSAAPLLALSAIPTRAELAGFMVDPNGTTAPRKTPRVLAGELAGWWDAASLGVPADGTTDAGPKLTEVAAALSAAGGGILYLRSPTPATPFYLDSTFRVPSRVRVIGVNKVLRGPQGRIGVMGQRDEGEDRFELRANSSGSTIQLETGAAATIPVGSFVVLRGENDAAGEALDRYEGTVTANGSDNLTVEPALNATYLVSYPGSAHGPGDKSLLTVVSQSALSGDVAAGATSLVVANGSLFQVGAQVSIEDELTGADVSGDSDNQVNMEVNVVVARDGNTLTFAFALAHAYTTEFRARVTKMLPVEDASVEDVTMEWAEAEDGTNRYAFFSQYARRCGFSRVWAKGDPAEGLGPRSQAIRIGEGSLDCWVEGCAVTDPASWGSGEGYGVAVYAGARGTRVSGNRFKGCRHSVVLFKGACDTQVDGNLSFDCRISDFDCHGAGETGAQFVGNLAVGGPSTDGESPPSAKAAYKVGNPTHRIGGSGIVFSGNGARDVDGEVLHVIAASHDIVWEGGGGLGCAGGFLIEGNSLDSYIAASAVTIRNTTLQRCGRGVTIDGIDAAMAVRGMLVDGLTILDGAAATLVNVDFAAALTLSNTRLERAVSGAASYVADIRSTTGLVVQGWRQQGGKGGFFLQDCPAFRMSGLDFAGVTSRTVLHDSTGGGTDNDGGWFTDYDCADFDADFDLTSAGLVIQARRRAYQREVSGETLTAMTGSGNQVPIDNTAPLVTEGTFVADVSLKPLTPNGRIEVVGDFPFVSADGATNIVASLYSGTTLLACKVERLTSGATSGGGLTVRGVLDHALTDLSGALALSLRIGCVSNSLTVTIGGKFAGADVPVLTAREI